MGRIVVTVDKPVKKRRSLVFRADVTGGEQKGVLKFGTIANGFDLNHAPVWDSLLPMLYLTRNAGPFFRGKDVTWYDGVAPSAGVKAAIRFKYAIDPAVADFFVDRCKRGWRYDLDVSHKGQTTHPGIEAEYHRALCLGDGKESRLLLGLLREIGGSPRVFHHGEPKVRGVRSVHQSTAHTNFLAERLFAALMSRPANLYIGTASGEAHYVKPPWRVFYDFAGFARLRELNRLLDRLGVQTRLHAPLTVLPTSLVQGILYQRYPHLQRDQFSVYDRDESRKNLRVSMMKMLYGIPFESHCPPDMFRRLVARWVRLQISPRASAYGADLECRGIIHHLRRRPEFGHVRSMIPASWESDWFRYVHTYLNPDIEPEILNILLKHAPPIEKAPPGTYRMPVDLDS